jgi:hypothetical protein
MTGSFAMAQDSVAVKSNKPVRDPFETTMLIDMQTIRNPTKGAFEIYIHHRFGTFQNGISDLIGIYAPSNIRLGFNYGIHERVSVGFGTEKNNKMQEFQWKVNILNQTRSNSIPLAIAYYGNFVIDARDTSVFGVNYMFKHRFSYFNQLIFARKFSDRLSLTVAPSYTHFNAVDSFQSHDKFGISAGGRFKIWNNNSVIFEYDLPVAIGSEVVNKPAQPNYGVGVEFGTSTHAFQVFVSSYNSIIAQKNFNFNQNNFFSQGALLGFNITVRI